MPTLLLCSSTKFLAAHPDGFLPQPLTGLRMAYCTTASKGVTDLGYLERAKGIFAANNYSYEEFDLDGKNPEWLYAYLRKFDAVYMQGGNTFYLLKSIRESGFEEVMRKRLEEGMVYVGASAGTYVTCPRVEMADWNEAHIYDHCGVTDLTGMGLVPFLVYVHYVPEKAERIKQNLPGLKYPLKILDDGQAILVEGDTQKLVGTGEETIISA